MLGVDLNPLEPGTGVVGRMRGGNIPLGYYNDPEKTAAAFITDSQGRRWSIPATTRCSRPTVGSRCSAGSVSINSGGERIFEEVEAR